MTGKGKTRPSIECYQAHGSSCSRLMTTLQCRDHHAPDPPPSRELWSGNSPEGHVHRPRGPELLAAPHLKGCKELKIS